MRSVMKRSLSVIMLAAFVMSISGCLNSRQRTDKKLPELFTDSVIVSVRYYYREGDGYRFEELDDDRRVDFINDLNSMQLETGGLMDYYWGGSFGIEMELDDGNYLTYDGTRLELRTTRIDEPYSKSAKKKSNYVYVLNCEFWDVMEGYFPSIVENGDKVYSRSPFH